MATSADDHLTKLRTYRGLLGITAADIPHFHAHSNSFFHLDVERGRQENDLDGDGEGYSSPGSGSNSYHAIDEHEHDDISLNPPRTTQKPSTTPKPHAALRAFLRAPGPGCYHMILRAESHTTTLYLLATGTISVFLLGQVVIAALITILSAGSISQNAVTSLGALNVAVASIVAWLRGQGFPGRLREYRMSLQNVRFQAELMDRQFQIPELARALDPVREALTVVTMWRNAARDAQTNHPDYWNASAEEKNSSVRAVGVKVPAAVGVVTASTLGESSQDVASSGLPVSAATSTPGLPSTTQSDAATPAAGPQAPTPPPEIAQHVSAIITAPVTASKPVDTPSPPTTDSNTSSATLSSLLPATDMSKTPTSANTSNTSVAIDPPASAPAVARGDGNGY